MSQIFYEDLETFVKKNSKDFVRVASLQKYRVHIMSYSLPPSNILDYNYLSEFVHFIYFISGKGLLATSEVKDRAEKVYEVGNGICSIIPKTTYFQIHNRGKIDLKFFMIMIPPETNLGKYTALSSD